MAQRVAVPGAVFLDRDGTINVKPADGGYVESAVQLQLLPGAAQAIRAINDRGLRAIVVTNQRGVALGRMSEADVDAVHARLSELLARQAGAWVDLVVYCPHDVGQCDCRKPRTGMFVKAQEHFHGLDFTRSAMIGDSPTDVEVGGALGMATIMLGRDASDLSDAVALVLEGSA